MLDYLVRLLLMQVTVTAAVAHIRESRKGVTLGGLKIKDLIDEGRKY